jgi:hypothetical protein
VNDEPTAVTVIEAEAEGDSYYTLRMFSIMDRRTSYGKYN